VRRVLGDELSGADRHTIAHTRQDTRILRGNAQSHAFTQLIPATSITSSSLPAPCSIKTNVVETAHVCKRARMRVSIRAQLFFCHSHTHTLNPEPYSQTHLFVLLSSTQPPQSLRHNS